MTKPTVICDHCGELTETHLKKRQHPNSVQEIFFKCEYCFYQYTVSVTDKKVRKMQKRVKMLTRERRLANVTKIENLQEKIKERMQYLKYNQVNFGKADL